MYTSGFICYNGEYIHADEPFLHADNRAFQFGDAISEDLHACTTEPQFLNWHVERLISGMQLLAMDIPAGYTPEVFRTTISKLLTKNRIFGGAAVRLTVFRNSAGSMVPTNHNVSFVLTCMRLEHNHYELNSRGYVIDIYHEELRFKHKFTSIKNANSFLFISAGIHNMKDGLDECILLNEKEKIVETVNANIFLVKGTSIFTPGLDEGCIPGITRRAVIELCTKSGFQMNDACSLSPKALEEADEIFLTDAVNGIRWVGAYRQYRYYKKTAQLLNRSLNEYAFNKLLDTNN